MIRQAAVSGRFYPDDKTELLNSVRKYVENGSISDMPSRAIVVPHAGYIFSGKTAGLTYSAVKIPDRVVIIGPNHYGRGPQISVMKEGIWRLPGFDAEIDEELAEVIIKNSRFAEDDATAHEMEHSIEVQIPFILYRNPRAKIVPICMYTEEDGKIEDIGEAIGHAIEKVDYNTLIVASSDMSHYVSTDTARKLDMQALRAIEILNWKELLETVRRENISMCGYAPVAAALKASIILQARKGRTVDYSTSGDALPGSEEVVGYAGVEIQ